MWLNMCPLVKSSTAIRLNAAQRLRFCRTGKIYGAATATKVTTPRTAVETVIILTQLIGRLMAGLGASAGEWREIHA